MFIPMLVGTTTLIVAGLALAAVGTGIQFQAARAQAKAGRKAAKATQKLASLQASRARRRIIRETRIRRGETANLAAQVGAGESSGLRGGLSGLASQAGSALGFSTQTEAIGQNITKFGIQISKARSLEAIGRGIQAISESAGRTALGFA